MRLTLIDALPHPSTFLPATRHRRRGSRLTVNVSAYQLTFRFVPGREQLPFSNRLGPVFEYAPGLNLFRNPAGELLQPPPVEKVHRLVDHDKCEVEGAGHHMDYSTLYDATMRPRAQWMPVEPIQHNGMRLVFATPLGIEEVYHHDPFALTCAVEYAVDYNIMRCNFPPGYPVQDPFIDVWDERIQPCTMQVKG